MPSCPTCTAIAWRGPTVTTKLPSPPIVKLHAGHVTQLSRRQKGFPTYADPVHTPATDVPSMTLQYEPAGRPVMNVVLHALSSLLIATNPSAPDFHACQCFSSPVSRKLRTTRESDLLVRRGDPCCERRASNFVPESDHAGNRLPAVLAEPEKGPCL